jgi:hypothetical protein
MKKQFLILITAAGLMLGAASHVKAMDPESGLLMIATGAVIYNRTRPTPEQYWVVRNNIKEITKSNSEGTLQYSVRSAYKLQDSNGVTDPNPYFTVYKHTLKRIFGDYLSRENSTLMKSVPVALENRNEALAAYQKRIQKQQQDLLDQAK